MERLETVWDCNPVFHLDFSVYRSTSEKSLPAILDVQFELWERKYGVSDIKEDYSARFRNLIETAYNVTGRQVVILIDKYDAPLVTHLGEESLHNSVRDFLMSIYSNLKSCHKFIRFGMLTGVSRFSKMTIFNGLNNLYDISLKEVYGEICGITEP